jgi:peptide chain release factor 1
MDETTTAKLDEIAAEHAGLLDELAKPDVVSDRDRYVSIAKRAAELEDIVRAYESYRAANAEAAEARELLAGGNNSEEEEYYSSAVTEAQARAEVAEAKLH